jgi:hypothetical protein
MVVPNGKMDCRVKPGNDEGALKLAENSIIVMPGLDPGIHEQSRS